MVWQKDANIRQSSKNQTSDTEGAALHAKHFHIIMLQVGCLLDNAEYKNIRPGNKLRYVMDQEANGLNTTVLNPLLLPILLLYGSRN